MYIKRVFSTAKPLRLLVSLLGRHRRALFYGLVSTNLYTLVNFTIILAEIQKYAYTLTKKRVPKKSMLTACR